MLEYSTDQQTLPPKYDLRQQSTAGLCVAGARSKQLTELCDVMALGSSVPFLPIRQVCMDSFTFLIAVTETWKVGPLDKSFRVLITVKRSIILMEIN